MSKNSENTAKRMMQEMITTFIPAKEDEIESTDVVLLTTEEIAARMAPVMQVDKTELAKELFDAGFRFIYEGDTWKWMLMYR